jgi:hypothetical protein
MEPAPARRDCDIEAVGKQRNGRPRFWCKTHQSSATGKFGRRLDPCEGSYRAFDKSQAKNIDPTDYPGGVGLWGAVRPVYDTSAVAVEEGIHVHLRRHPDDERKEFDGTVRAVALSITRTLFDAPKAFINMETAVAAYISRFLERPMMSLFCTYCGEPHLDSEWFAVKLHKRHLCHGCGKVFLANEKCVSNPLERLRHMVGDREETRKITPATRVLARSQADFPGGVQIWASNPALFWTSPKAEEEGIHFHGYAADGESRIEDDTFAEITLDGISLNKQHLRYFMAQQALKYLEGKIVSLQCACGEAYFDEGEAAFRPHATHACRSCGKPLGTQGGRKKVVSNPFVDTISALQAAVE